MGNLSMLPELVLTTEVHLQCALETKTIWRYNTMNIIVHLQVLSWPDRGVHLSNSTKSTGAFNESLNETNALLFMKVDY